MTHSAKVKTFLRCIAAKWNFISCTPYQLSQRGQFSTSVHSYTSKEYAYEMSCSNVRFGEGVTKEIGLDCKNMGAKNVCLMTDHNLMNLEPVIMAMESLERHGIPYKVYDQVRVEPSDESFKDAIRFAKDENFDLFVAVGGGSVMDTCKAANLYSSNPAAEFLDYVNAPIGKGKPVTHALRPLIAVTTTAGTGSETTGTAVFDFVSLKAKTGISHRALRPTLGILDPLHLRTLPDRVAAYSGLDAQTPTARRSLGPWDISYSTIFCHAIESFTALPYYERTPRPENPLLRPAYQGNNPISDVWSKHALRVTSKYLTRAVYNVGDREARSEMLLASCFAGIGFGNAGVHLCHGMSYPISGLVKDFRSEDYDPDHPLIPHGLSVIITAPAVFMFTASASPERHLEAAECLGADIKNVKRTDAGKVLSETLRHIMHEVRVPNGLHALGFTSDDIPALVKGTLPQHRVTKLSPKPFTEEDLAAMLEASMTVY